MADVPHSGEQHRQPRLRSLAQPPGEAGLTVARDVVRGGAAVSVGNGTTIEGGTVVFRGTPTPGQPGNTWVGVEIDPRTGQIRFVNRSDNSVNGDGSAAAAAQTLSMPATAAGLIHRGRTSAPEQ